MGINKNNVNRNCDSQASNNSSPSAQWDLLSKFSFLHNPCFSFFITQMKELTDQHFYDKYNFSVSLT